MIRLPRRRRFIVDRLQYAFLAAQALYGLVFVGVLATIVFTPSVVTLFSRGASPRAQQVAADEFLVLHARLWPAALALFVLILAHMALVSHRVAGPLYRLRATYRVLGSGDFSVRVRLRRHDLLHADARALNEMVDALDRRMLAIRIQAHVVENAAADVRAEEIARLRGMIDQFTTTK